MFPAVMALIEKKYGQLKFYDSQGVERSVESVFYHPSNLNTINGYVNASMGWSPAIGSKINNLERIGEYLSKEGGLATLIKDHSGHTSKNEPPLSGTFSIDSDLKIEEASYLRLLKIIQDFYTNETRRFNFGHSYGAYVSMLSAHNGNGKASIQYDAMATIEPIFSFRSVIEENGLNPDSQKFRKILDWAEGSEWRKEFVYRTIFAVIDFKMKGGEGFTERAFRKVGCLTVDNPKLLFQEIMEAEYIDNRVEGLETPNYIIYCKNGGFVAGQKPIDDEKEDYLKQRWEKVCKNMDLEIIGDEDGPTHSFKRKGISFADEHFESSMDKIIEFYLKHKPKPKF